MSDLRKERNLENEIGAAKSGNNGMLKRVGIIGAVALVAFLLGFLPMWLSARNYENERDAARANLRQSLLQNKLATAAINAKRAEYEQARQETSDFYTDLRAEIERDKSVFDSRQRANLQPILAGRDATITLLARGDAASAERLADLYFAFMQTKNPAAEKK